MTTCRLDVLVHDPLRNPHVAFGRLVFEARRLAARIAAGARA